jgi:hypothetical protein
VIGLKFVPKEIIEEHRTTVLMEEQHDG